MDEAVKEASIIVAATGCEGIITDQHFMLMEEDAIVCNIGHSDGEIDVAGLKDNAREKIHYQASSSLTGELKSHCKKFCSVQLRQ